MLCLQQDQRLSTMELIPQIPLVIHIIHRPHLEAIALPHLTPEVDHRLTRLRQPLAPVDLASLFELHLVVTHAGALS